MRNAERNARRATASAYAKDAQTCAAQVELAVGTAVRGGRGGFKGPSSLPTPQLYNGQEAGWLEIGSGGSPGKGCVVLCRNLLAATHQRTGSLHQCMTALEDLLPTEVMKAHLPTPSTTYLATLPSS